MMDENKIITLAGDNIPLVRASPVHIDDELVVSEIREAEYVVISSESSNTIEHMTGSSSIQRHGDYFHQQRQNDNDLIRSNIKSSSVGAWAAGTILGFLVGGTSLSMILGISAAFCSQQEEGLVGDVARAIGDVALLSHEKFLQVDEKHHLVDRIRNSALVLSRNCLDVVRSSINYVLADDYFQLEEGHAASKTKGKFPKRSSLSKYLGRNSSHD